MGEQFQIDLGGAAVPVTVRRNKQAKRLILRVDRATGEIKLTVPSYVGAGAARKFLTKQRDWIAKERAEASVQPKISHGSELLYLGEPHCLVFTDQSPRRIERSAAEIRVGGPVDLAPKRLETWLRLEAKRVLEGSANKHADTLGVTYNRISIGDMKSRWGSCSSRGTLRFSWRLLMAPNDVLDYVAAHEVAHLLEMNHSDRFWQHVAKCVPEYKTLRRWLKTEGNDLFSVRF